MDVNPTLSLPELFTDTDGRARWRSVPQSLSEGSPQARLSVLTQGGGFQFRMSPVGFRSSMHCTVTPQWLIVMSGAMEIGLQDGTSRVFLPGQAFYSNDTLPAGANFDPSVHGHWSRQVGDQALVTMFVRT